MADRPIFLRALAAVAGSIALVPALGGTLAAPAHADDGDAPVPLVDDAPLRVTIGAMSPAALPTDPVGGDITITGTVTNRTDETWTGITVYAFLGDKTPVMRNQSQLAAAMTTPYDEYLGDRFTDLGIGEPGDVEELAPGESEPFTVVVPSDVVQAKIAQAGGRAGVYWFGVHALGESPGNPADDLADGRARTFLPFVPRRFTSPVETTLVVPFTQPVRYDAEGRVADVEEWERALSPDGRLSGLLDFVRTSGRPVTWLVDPAVVDAVGHLAAGNQPRSLGPTGGGDGATDEPTATGSPDDGGDDGADGGDGADGTGGGEDAEPLPDFALTAQAWLDRFGQTLQGEEVLSLPYGNIDVPAALAHDPGLLDLAVSQRSEVLDELDLDEQPAISSPSGYLDVSSIEAADPDSRLLVTDRMFGDQPPALAEVDGHRLFVTSYGATQGSPGPGPSVTSVGLRQRILAEAAVRVIKSDRRPLVVVLPLSWGLADPVGFFSAFNEPWVALGTLEDAATGALATEFPAEDLDYIKLQRRRTLDAETVAGVSGLITAGDTLQDVLLDNNAIAGVITEEALTGLSFFVRNDEAGGRATTAASRAWVDERLGSVTISASDGVTLSGASGTFPVTLRNGLDHTVTVDIGAESDDGIEVISPGPVEMTPRSRQTVLLEARTTSNRVHNVTLVVTDADGAPLGGQDELPIRSAQVSDVIWLIMGTGAGLLFLAIAVRLVRRARAARRRPDDAAGAPAGPTRDGPRPDPVEAV